jgi:hypothetical protein
LLLAIELADAGLAEEVLYRCLAKGLSFKVGQGNVIVLAPPLVIGSATSRTRLESWKQQSAMANPVVAEIRRGSLVESRHRGSIAVVDADGSAVLALGSVDTLVYPRSAVKAMQALVLMESGAADRFELNEEALALACASHGGEPGHVAVAERMLAGRRPRAVGACLRCALAEPRTVGARACP